MSEVRIDPPVANLVCIGQRISGHETAESHMIELAALGLKTSLDIPEAFPIRQFSKGHAKVLIHATESVNFVIPAVATYTAAKGVQRKIVHHLRKYELS